MKPVFFPPASTTRGSRRSSRAPVTPLFASWWSVREARHAPS